MAKICFAFLIFVLAGSAEVGAQSRRPTEAELKEVVKRIYNSCELQIYGRVRQEGERSPPEQSRRFVTCVDEMAGAYLKGVKGQ